MNELIKKLTSNVRQRGLSRTSKIATRKITSSVCETLSGHRAYYLAQKKRYLRNYASQSALDPIWIDPNKITALVGTYDRRDSGHLDYTPHFKPRELSWSDAEYRKEVPYRSVQGGDWDQATNQFTDLLMYKAIERRFTDNVHWTETDFYERKVEQYIADGLSKSQSASRVSDECDKIEQLYQQIKNLGYLSQRELKQHPLHEVTICISRNGECMYNCEGRHRLSVAKVLDLSTIPVLVLSIHRELLENHESNNLYDLIR